MTNGKISFAFACGILVVAALQGCGASVDGGGDAALRGRTTGWNPFRACGVESGPATTEVRALDAFDAIEIHGGADVRISRGETQAVSVTAPKSALAAFETRVSGGTLSLEARTCAFSSSKTVQVAITVPALRSIEVAGSGNVNSPDLFETEGVHLAISGSGVIVASFKAKTVDASIGGSGTMKLAGAAEALQAEISGSGDIAAFPLVAERASVSINGSGNAQVTATTKLDAEISGAGTIVYKGNPPTVNAEENGSGEIKRGD